MNTQQTLHTDIVGREGLINRSRKLISYWRKRLQAIRKPSPQRFVMFDSVEVGHIPANAPAVAGYVDGIYDTWTTIVSLFRGHRLLSIAVTADGNAKCLDVENGDASPSDAPGWIKRQQRRGVKRPIIYANLSTMGEVRTHLKNAGIPRRAYMLWVAHYVFHPEIPAGYDACQWTDNALGKNLDESLCEPWFL